MRNSYIITYDICDPKRLRKTFQTMKNWGEHLQYSVFECQLTRLELLQVKFELKQLINQSEDQILFIDLGPSTGRSDRKIESLGKSYGLIDSPCLIV